jgi:hypothetical protein
MLNAVGEKQEDHANNCPAVAIPTASIVVCFIWG